jgi:hypothetical protein
MAVPSCPKIAGAKERSNPNVRGKGIQARCSATIFSMWYVCGNISTGCTSVIR